MQEIEQQHKLYCHIFGPERNATTIRKASLDVIDCFRLASERQADHLLNERFVNLDRESGASQLWEICYRCVGRMHHQNEDYYVDAWQEDLRRAEDGTQWIERRPLQYSPAWHNYSSRSKYAETPAKVAGALRRLSETSV